MNIVEEIFGYRSSIEILENYIKIYTIYQNKFYS